MVRMFYYSTVHSYLVCSTQSRPAEDKHKLKPESGRSILLDVLSTLDEKYATSSNRLPLMPLNTQNTPAPSLQPVNDQGASIEESFKGLSIRGFLRQIMLASKTPSSSSSKTPLQIIDLDFDCLEYVFNDLSFQDLINVAGACTYLQTDATKYFASHVKNHEVIIDCDQYPRYTVQMQSNRWPHEFKGSDFEAFNFGLNEVIEKLTIINLFPVTADELRIQTDTQIERVIVETFTGKKKLSELKFIRCGPRMMKSYTSMEFHVGSVAFERCVLGDSAFDWPNLFPSMQKLAIFDCDVTMALPCIEKTFPHLKCFDLTASHSDINSWFDCAFSEPNVQRAFDENPGIEKLSLRYWNGFAYDAKLLKYAAEHLVSLQSLHLWHWKYTEFFSKGPIEFSSVRKFTLSNDYYHPEKLNLNLAKLTFRALEKFYLLGHYDAECVTFLARHQNIRKFICHPHGPHSHYPTDFDLKTFGNTLPQLKVLCIAGNRLTPAALIQFILDCATVSMIKIRNLKFSPALRERFGKDCKEHGWKVSYEDDVPKIVMKRI